MTHWVYVHVCIIQRSELEERGAMSVVGDVLSRALDQDFAAGFRPEDHTPSQ